MSTSRASCCTFDTYMIVVRRTLLWSSCMYSTSAPDKVMAGADMLIVHVHFSDEFELGWPPVYTRSMSYQAYACNE